MKNLTLRIDEKVLAGARKLAALRGTTVAQLVRDYLTALVEGREADKTSAEEARLKLIELAELSRSGPGAEGKWDREDIYAERMDRLRKERPDAPGFAEEPSAGDMQMIETAAAILPALEEMTTGTGAPPVARHDEWFRKQVLLALEDKKSGKSDYRDFDEVAAEFGFGAR